LRSSGRPRRILYVESQYFASHKIAEAIAERLREPEGPEIVVVNPQSAEGWLEEEVMGSSRARMLRLVQAADIHGRFRLYYPVTDRGTPIYVHAKVLIMDDQLVRVGSSNLNNRSLGFDTECDLAVEALPGGPEENTLCQKIVRLRSDLLAEHLGTVSHTVEQAIAGASGSLIGGIEALRSSGRSLVPFEPPELNVIEERVMAENELLDPERPSRPWRRLRLSGLLQRRQP
jgi:phospholipase D1/2